MKTKGDFAYSKAGGQHLYRDPRTGIFLTRFTVRGRAYRLSTGQRDARAAQEAAYQRYCDIFFGKAEPQKQRILTTAPTFAELTKVFLAEIVAFSGQRVSQASARGYVNTLARVIAATFDRPEVVRIDKLSPALLKAYRAARYTARGLNIAKDKDLILNYSLNSEQTNALSVFSNDAIRLYKTHGWKMPEGVMELKDASKLPAKKPDFTPIDDATDKLMIRLAAAALDSAVELSESEARLIPSPQTAVIYELARFCSLTNKEIQNARWNWIAPEHNRIRIAGNSEFSTKRNAKDRQIPVSPERVARWIAALPHADDTQYIVSAETETKRLDATARTANEWIKRFIPDRKKGLHELRKMATSDFLRATNGDVYKVAETIGDDPRTMLKYYASVLDMNISAL